MEYLASEYRPRDYAPPKVEVSRRSLASRSWVPRLLGLLGCPRAIQPLGAPLPAGLAGSQEEEEEEGAQGESLGGVAFGGLPDHLLEGIFSHLVGSSRRTHFSVCGVSRTWRELGRNMFFASPWSGAHLICHPVQLFCLSPRPVTTTRTGMLKCFVKREACGMGQQRRFSLFMGRDHRQARRVRFLMCAQQASRWELLVFLDKECRCAPVGRLTANAFCTRYTLALAPGVQLLLDAPAGQGGWASGALPSAGQPVSGSSSGGGGSGQWAPVRGSSAAPGAAEGTEATPSPLTQMGCLQYKARLRALMQPRKVEVELPAPWQLSFGQALPTLSRISGAAGASAAEAARAPAEEGLLGREGVEHSFTEGGAAHGTVGEGGSGALWPGAAHAAAPPPQPQPGPATLAPPLGTPLRNKPPQWNADLKCWCLNFRGRVKQASVKNFQLVRDGDPAERVVLQFGKVERDVYILDFNPTVVTAFQAFSIALSTFDGKLML